MTEKPYVRLKIIIGQHSDVAAIINVAIPEGELRDFSLQTGEYELTVVVEEIVKT